MAARDPSPSPTLVDPATPSTVLATWPQDRRIALLNRGSGAAARPRWTLVTEPGRISVLPSASLDSDHRPQDARDWLTRHLPSRPLDRTGCGESGSPPWTVGSIALLAYELGARLEPAAAPSRRPPDADDEPWDAWIAEANWSLAFDHEAQVWHRVGPVPDWAWATTRRREEPLRFRLGALESATSDRDFQTKVRRCVELVHAGDLFQANISRGFDAVLEGDPRGLASAALAEGARFGGYVETSPHEAVLSLSPELLVAVEAGGVVRSCPIKGTRPADGDLDAFASDAKDAAELAMIVDLMRNDLGRLCRAGSIRVLEPRRLERHPTIVHGVAEIEGRLREAVTVPDLLEAVFPAGSISGAPKIRAMQVIDSLEGARRGIYCGSIAWFDAEFESILNVGIRTASIRRASGADVWRLRYRAGCGIVADSDPASESRESRDKVRVLARLSRDPVTPPGEKPDPADVVVPQSLR